MAVNSPPKDQVPLPSPQPTNEEDYNVPSTRRVDLLLKLHKHLKAQAVPAYFWAACQICDMEMLEEFIKTRSMDVLQTSFMTGPSMIHACKLNT
jgi:hypothetical protein